MYETVLLQFIEQLKDELRTIDRIIADVERLRAVAADQPRRGRPPGRSPRRTVISRRAAVPAGSKS
jgi:hypothetical protein